MAIGNISNSSKPRSRVRVVADLLVVAMAIATAWRIALLVRPPAAISAPTKRLMLGSRVDLPLSRAGAGRRFVVIAVQSSCPYCGANADFYHRLVASTVEQPDVRIVLVSPDSPSTLAEWARRHDIHPHAMIADVDLLNAGFAVTPTLALTDDDGIVTDIMARELSDSDQDRVMARLRGQSDSPLQNIRYAALIDIAGLAALEERILVDIRDRTEFARDHDPRSTNIPFDELEQRGPAELDLRRAVVIDCRQARFMTCEYGGERLYRLGAARVFLLVREVTQ